LWVLIYFFFSSRRRHTRLVSDRSSDVCSSDLERGLEATVAPGAVRRTDLDRRAGSSRSRATRPTASSRGSGTALGVSRHVTQEKIGRAACRGKGEREGGAGAREKENEGRTEEQ